jgi:hypothetical protein
VAATIAVHRSRVFAIVRRLVAPLFVDVTLPIVGTVPLWEPVEHVFVALALRAETGA